MHSLYETVKEILESRRVGDPVFVRCNAHVALENENVSIVLARILSMASSWLEATPMQVYAQIDHNLRQISTTVRYTDGQTAIVTVSTVYSKTSLDLMVLGNKGALYHDAAAIAPGFDIMAEPIPIPDWLMDALNQSIRDGEPAYIEEVMDIE
ncbi:hypothetical protein GF312_22755 [Candidatus Poribacteria bacterium]|nr:hypothetical protein [Candidatus Poribacteria bacterium]